MAAVLNIGPALAGTILFAPAGQEFSIQFPLNPQISASNDNGETLVLWQAQDEGFLYIAIRSTNPVSYDPQGEPAKDLENFVKETNAVVTEQHRSGWSYPGGLAAALVYSFKMPNGMLGQGVYIVTGNRGFGAAVIDTIPAGRQAALSAYINSLKILK